ncbi:hypothetical protein NEF87_001882 [Candidatus Lokiarchaeum ossiferum]|uniref:Uncharacterized protein n=1 Tax=Candidatus Lokiarchaeum ossiferum TaxID=2951803 RepID=A0ABY6HRV0_9ARCH|nr:hypothetical protein NEF87_001882 [Candidatus Lokiarchaeum sp. B-35]
MDNFGDLSIAAYIAKYMLSHKRLSLEILKDEFKLDDQQVRQAIIRLYYQGKIFGFLKASETGSIFLNFSSSDNEINLQDCSIQEIMDWDVSKFNLDELRKSAESALENDNDFQDTDSNPAYSRVKETNQKDLISVEMYFDIACEKVALHVHINNISPELIEAVILRINFENYFHISGIQPDIPLKIEENYCEVELGTIKKALQKKIIIFFDFGKRMNELSVNGYMRYKNFEGYARFIRLENINVDQTLPVFTPEKCDPKMVKTFMKSKHVNRRIQSFGITNFADTNLAFQNMIEVSKEMGFELISKVEKDQSQMVFFFAKFHNPSQEAYRILLVPQCKNNVLAFYCCAIYETIVANLIRKLCFNLVGKLRSKRLITDQDQLIDMNCIRCKKMMNIFPPKGDVIACSSCQLLQTPWK